jgi:hypothetical protein
MPVTGVPVVSVSALNAGDGIGLAALHPVNSSLGSRGIRRNSSLEGFILGYCAAEDLRTIPGSLAQKTPSDLVRGHAEDGGNERERSRRR